MEAVYCGGAVEVNHNGITRRCTEALTAADGTVFVSSLTTLSEIEIASHEIVHFNERKNTAAYNDYKSAVCENLLFASDTFKRICHEINENHYDGRYDVEDVDYAEKFLREILAYLNEFTTTDPDSAYRRFSGMFKDWQSAVKASEKFNNDIGADFEESAFFAPENGESLMHEPSDQELALNKSLEEEFAAGVQNRGTLSAAQQYVKNLAELFGVNLEWTDGPRIEEGFYNRRTRTIVLSTGPDTVESLIRVFGHELAHCLESCKLYGKFVKYLTGQSKSFAKFVETRLADYGVDTDGTQSRLDALLDAIVKKRKTSKVMSENARRNFGRDSALYELAADFIGHKVFGECDMEAVREIVMHQPTVFERIMDWIRSLIRRITGDKRFATARSDMEYILGYLNRVYHSRRTQSSEVSPGRYNRDSDTAYAGNTAESLIEDGDNQYSLPIRPDKNIFEEYANGDITRDEAMAELDDYVKHVRTLKEKRLSSENAEPLKAFDKNVYGFNLQLWRLSRGMSREELAIWFQMSEKGVRKIERGNSNPELASLAKIAELTGISIEEMSSPDFIIDVPGLKQVLTEYLNGKTNYQQRDAKAKELIEKSGYSDSRELEEMWDVLAPEIPAAGTNIFRRLLGMNQTEFGEEIGVAINTVANIEKNMYDLDGAAIANVSQIAEVSLNDFMSNPIIADEELVRKLNIIARRYYTGKINEVSFKNALINLLDDYAPQGHEKSGISLAEGTVNNAEPERPFADGWRNSKAYVLNDEEIAEIKKEIHAIGADESVFVFNYGSKTGYWDKTCKIHIKGDILPDIYSKHPRDRMSIRAVLAHEYYGHWTYREKPFEIGSWKDEFRASYMAAKNAPGLTDEDRRFLVLDAVTRAEIGGVPIQYNDFMFKMVYGR